jgi:hypothetical protein
VRQYGGWWVFFAVSLLFLLSQILLGAKRRRTAGFPVDVRAVIVCIIFLGFVAVAIFRVLTHP